MDQKSRQQHFYQKLPTWVAISFLSGATVMVAAVALVGLPEAPSSSATLAAPLDNGGISPLIAVNFTQPSEGQAFSFQASIPVSVVAQGQENVKSIAVWADDQLVGTCFTAVCSTSLPAASLATRPIHTLETIATSESDLTASSLVHFSILAGQ